MQGRDRVGFEVFLLDGLLLGVKLLLHLERIDHLPRGGGGLFKEVVEAFEGGAALSARLRARVNLGSHVNKYYL